MPRVSINEIVRWTQKTRATVTKKIANLAFSAGPKQSKLYDSNSAMEAIYGRGGQGDGGEFISQAEANRILTLKRCDEIDLSMEVTRKERIPLDLLCLVNEETFANVAGMLKSQEGKTLTAEMVNDLFTELRALGMRIKERAVIV